MKLFSSLLIIAVLFSIYPPLKESNAAITTDIRHSSLGYLENCTELSPADLTGAGVDCGGINGFDTSRANAIALFFKYESASSLSGWGCSLFGADERFTDSGSLIFPAVTTYKVSAGTVELSPINIVRNTTLGEDLNFVIPISYDRIRIRCDGNGTPAVGDTLAVAVRLILAP